MTHALQHKADLLRQKGISIWLIGLSGAGKTTIAAALETYFFQQSYFSVVQDADTVRLGINKGLGYSIDDRKENIRRAAEVSRLLIENAVISINAFICPTEEMRKMVFSILGRDNVVLVYLSTPLEVCEQRDVKGMYKKARSGELKSFTGIDSIFEKPENYDLELDTSAKSLEECITSIFNKVKEIIRY